MIGKHPRVSARVKAALAEIGPATTAEVYEYMLGARNKDMPSRMELNVLLPRIPGVRRVSPDGQRPARYEYAEGIA